MRATALAFPTENLVGWERSLMAFLVEKELIFLAPATSAFSPQVCSGLWKP
jgi:hypothetical protein